MKNEQNNEINTETNADFFKRGSLWTPYKCG
jgi:hypothetical protein